MANITDIQILLSMHESDIPPSIPELAQKTGKSVAHVHDRLEELERLEFITPPPKKNMARARTITDLGREYLRQNGFLPTTVFDTLGR